MNNTDFYKIHSSILFDPLDLLIIGELKITGKYIGVFKHAVLNRINRGMFLQV